MNKYFPVLFLVCCVPAFALGQQTAAVTQQQQESQKEDVVRISVKLVQIDGTVTDKNGQPVTDLKKADFDLVVDGRPQTITYFAYIPAQPTVRPEHAVAGNDLNDPGPPPPSGRLRPEQVRRTIALVIGNVSFDGMRDVKKALYKFVDEQMQPGDLVSIVRPVEGAGVLQQLTTDKRLLHRAIDGVRWNPLGGVGVSAVPQSDDSTAETDPDAAGATNRAEAFYDDAVGSAWLRSLSLIVRGLDGLPGRKSVILFSDGFQLFGKDQDNSRIQAQVHRLTDQATRALVVFYTVDARGLQPLNFGAAEGMDMDPVSPIGAGPMRPTRRAPPDYARTITGRGVNFVRSQDGLSLIAEQTGGRFLTDPRGAIPRILNDQSGYYVIGYRPEEDTFKLAAGSRPYHEIKIGVKRPNLRARFRKGFYGSPDKKTAAAGTTGAKLVAALKSPFDSSDVGLRLTSLFGYDKVEGAFVRSLLHVEAQALAFTKDDDGRQKAVLNILAAAFDENGIVGNPVAQKYTVRVRDERLDQVKRDGLVYELMTPVEESGIYQVRVAIEDSESGRIGSASQFIAVPDVKTNRLTLSGIVLAGEATKSNELPPGPIEFQAGPAVRRFRQGAHLNYAYIVLNAQTAPATRLPQVEPRVLLYREGKLVFRGPVRTLDPGSQPDLRQLIVRGNLNLGAELGPGEYVLQVIVTDKLAQDRRYRTTTRWIDFDIVE